MPDAPSFAHLDFWSRREAEVLLVTADGLKALAAAPPADDDEDTLNWALKHHIRQAVLTHRASRRVSIEPPSLEPRSTPRGAVGGGPQPRDRKRPDLVWEWCDEHASAGSPPFLEMVIECKRLGAGDLCRLYVAQGVARFFNEEHSYAKEMRSGFMVGYLQNISAADSRERVAQVLSDNGIAPLLDPVLAGSTFAQQLRRSYPIDPFCLHHVWHPIPAP